MSGRVRVVNSGTLIVGVLACEPPARRRVIGRAGLLLFGVLYAVMFFATWWAEGHLPPAAWPMLFGAVGGAAYGYLRYWRARG